jgi:uncharacterized protein YciI
MSTYVYIGHDGPKGAELRPEVRDAHITHLSGLEEAGKIIYAGPLRNDAGQPCGSIIIFEAEDLATARQTAESDPYLTSGVFDRLEVHESKQVFPRP